MQCKPTYHGYTPLLTHIWSLISHTLTHPLIYSHPCMTKRNNLSPSPPIFIIYISAYCAIAILDILGHGSYSALYQPVMEIRIIKNGKGHAIAGPAIRQTTATAALLGTY